MKTEKELKALLREKEKALKAYGKPAIVSINASLALTQCHLEGQISVLKFILL